MLAPTREHVSTQDYLENKEGKITNSVLMEGQIALPSWYTP
jgi:hypothetical protein